MNRSLGLNAALVACIAFFVTLVGLPFWWVVSGSIKIPQEIIARTPTMVPQSFTLQHYQKLFDASAYPVYLVNSLIVAASSTVLTLLLAIPAALAIRTPAGPAAHGAGH